MPWTTSPIARSWPGRSYDAANWPCPFPPAARRRHSPYDCVNAWKRNSGTHYETFLDWMAAMRKPMSIRYPDFDVRRGIWYAIVDSDVLELLKEKRTEDAVQRLIALAGQEVVEMQKSYGRNTRHPYMAPGYNSNRPKKNIHERTRRLHRPWRNGPWHGAQPHQARRQPDRLDRTLSRTKPLEKAGAG